MNQSQTDSDISLSPSQILERLQVLRQLQLFQRGKLRKQRLQYEQSPETSSSVTDIVSHFSNSTSYNTFRSLLQVTNDTCTEGSPCTNTSDIPQNVKEQDLIEGISVLNLSQESEFINSPTSSRSRVSVVSICKSVVSNENSPLNDATRAKSVDKKQISLDEMPILSPKKDFETLVLEKLKNEKSVPKNKSPKEDVLVSQPKKRFLKRGEGMARFGLKKNNLVIQNTKSLPWRRNDLEIKSNKQTVNKALAKNKNKKIQIEIQIPENKDTNSNSCKDNSHTDNEEKVKSPVNNQKGQSKGKDGNYILTNNQSIDSSNCELHTKKQVDNIIQLPKEKHPLPVHKGKTWKAVLTKEQDDFLRQLKQSDYYKNFTSPAKSIVSDTSCDEYLTKLAQEREQAEQNMFELLESKTCRESFNFENSFISKFLRKNKFECSGESTPLIMQKCLASNPDLLHIFPDFNHQKHNKNSYHNEESCSEYTECCSDTCTSVSTCCSCKTIEEVNQSHNNLKEQKTTCHNDSTKKVSMKVVENELEKDICQKDKEIDVMKSNMAEMNAKLLATSELLKDRLRELEDEIETFRTENANLTKMREEIELERQKFYEEKGEFEKKFNEENILSEYYLAEEKEKLTKQKQMYERYVREMRGQLNKKDKDQVTNLKKEINDLKEEIRLKDAKSTSTIARLRNQLKIMEKEKKDLQDEIEKLKKENRRIEHSNAITRRLTNMKYLEEINKKLTNINANNTRPQVDSDSNVKYKAFEIERQSRSKKILPLNKNTIRPRAKSVPNLKVTSRYAKYFSQRDVISEIDKEKSTNVEHIEYTYSSDDEHEVRNGITSLDDTESISNRELSDNDENNLEKIYMERFQSNSPKSTRSSLSNSENIEKCEQTNVNNDFFINKSHNRGFKSVSNTSTSHLNRSKSPISILSSKSVRKSPLHQEFNVHKSTEHESISSSNISNRSKSPISVLSNHSSSNRNITTVINRNQYVDKLAVSPEPTASKSSVNKTIFNPTEIRKPDGTKELRFPNGNVKYISPDGKYSKFVYYNGDIKENFYDDGRIKYYYAETKTFHTTYADGLEVLEFPDGQVEKRYKDGSSEIRLPNGSIRYSDPKNEHVREEWRFPDGATLTVAANGDQRIVFSNGQVEVHTKDHKRREFPDGTVKLVYNDGTSETRYASGRVRIKDKQGNLIMDSAPS